MPPDTQGLPWPEGEPGAARAAARRAASVAAALESIQGTVAGTDAPGWTGTAATAFDGAVQRDAMALMGAGAAFTRGSGALEELATKLEAAQERVLEAARRLREAREAAAAAEARATDARQAATAAHTAALFDPTSSFSGVLSSEATMAEDAALRAESAAAMARDELARVEAWAQREADDAVADGRAADQRAAGELDSAAAGAGGLGVTTGMPGAALATGGGLGHVGDYLTADLFNYWGGGPNDDTIPLGKMVLGGTFMWGTYQYLRASSVAASWARVAPMAAGTFTELTAMQALARFPTFNNGLVGGGLARGMSAVPALRPAGSWLSNASRATPVFRRLGIAGGAFSTVMDAHHLIEQGNPVDAFQREGAGYVADVARTGFSASTTAFLIAPNPVTGGAVLVTGAVWLGAEAWDHREAIGDAVATGAEFAWDHSLPGTVWNHREEIGDAFNSGVDMAQDLAGEVGERWDDGVDMVGDGLSGMADTGGDLVEGAGDLLGIG
jgi:hypothetical protein